MAEEGEGSGGGIVGFLFGNVNEQGELEDDGLLDADSRRQIGQLHDVLGSFIGDLKSEDSAEDELPALEEKAPDAVDYGDIDELCDDQTRSHHVRTALGLVKHTAAQPQHGISPLAMTGAGAASSSVKSTAAADDDDDYDDYDTPVPASIGQASGPSPSCAVPRPAQPHASPVVPTSVLSSPAMIHHAAGGLSPGKPVVEGFLASPQSATAKATITPKSNFIPARLSSLGASTTSVASVSPSSATATTPASLSATKLMTPASIRVPGSSGGTSTMSLTHSGDSLSSSRSSSDTPMDSDSGGAMTTAEVTSPADAQAPPPVDEEPQRSREEILMLARKYYPNFHPNKVIRFSRLFGPGRASSIPRTWKDIAQPRKRHHRTSSSSVLDDSQSEDEMEKGEEKDREAETTSKENGIEPGAEKAKNDVVWHDDTGRLRFGCKATAEDKDAGEEVRFLKCTIRGRASKQLDFDGGGFNNSLASESERINKLVQAAAWRHGPAALLYDLLGIADDAVEVPLPAGCGGGAAGLAKKKRASEAAHQQQLDYGLLTNGTALSSSTTTVVNMAEEIVPVSPTRVIKEDAYSMVTQAQWEDEIIWKDEDIVARGGLKISTVTANHAGLQAALQRRGGQAAGALTSTPGSWKPRTPSFQQNRTPSTTGPGASGGRFPNGSGGNSAAPTAEPEKKETWYSIFPVENDNLLNDDWTKGIIWDDQELPGTLNPIIMKLNSNDENLVLGLPDDVAPSDDLTTPNQGKKDSKKPKVYGLKKDKPPEDTQSTEPQVAKDPFNLSNDGYYSPQLSVLEAAGPTTSSSRLTVQHSTPALELHPACFPTHISIYELRSFHRHALKLLQRGPLAGADFKPVTSVSKHMKKKTKEREKERAASGGGEVFFMRCLDDLSAMDGEVVLVEACEEHPPVLMQRGMAGRIVTYYKRKPVNDPGPAKCKYGEVAYIQQSPFLGSLAPGEALQGVECSLYRSPIYEHKPHPTDFIIIRTQEHYYIREYNGLFVMGQLCPKIEVPGPNSKRAGEHVREFLKVFIFRLFRNSGDNPRRIKMETIRKAFPSHSESSVRKRLKLCADFKRTGAGNDCGWWVLKEDFQLPSEEKMRALMTPENCCAFYSMLATEQRLKDAGFGGKSMFAEEEEEDNQKMDDEVLTAPWHTTRNFVAAGKGKCQLAVFGNADPTGCGEGFSYARVPNKPMQGKEEGTNPTPAQQKKAVTGTDADLRRLSLKNAREVLKKDFSYTEEELNKLGRWAVIDALRTHSTQAAKEGKDGMKNSKFARGSRFSMAEHQERYRDDCQRIFDIQNRVLASEEVLSTDEGSSSEDEGRSLDKLASGLDSFLTSSKTTSQLTYEQEEAERHKLQDLLDREKDDKKEKDKGEKSEKGKGSKSSPSRQDNDDASVGSNEDQPWVNVSGKNRRLVIHRTFEEDGKLFKRTEIVTHPDVIDAYLRVAGKKDKSVYAEHDEHTREAMRREKRRIQEQLRRIKRNEEKERIRAERRRKKMEEKEQNPNLAKMRCGACGLFGHMKTNKHCPKYIAKDNPPSVTAEEPDVTEDDTVFPQDHLVKLEGTKLSFDKSVLERTNRKRQDSLRMRIPRDLLRKRRRALSEHCDYLQRHAKTTHRRRINPHVDMCNHLKNIVEKMKLLPDSYLFHVAVPAKQAPDYNTIVKEPMHLQLLKDNIRECMYRSREEFMKHVDLMVQNSVLYNGAASPLTQIAEGMRQTANAEIAKVEKQLANLESKINPLLSDDPMVTFCCHLESVTQKMKTVPDSWPFYLPVSIKEAPDYKTIVKNPMDVQTLQKNCQEHYYRSREDFLRDVQLLHSNSLLYNGSESPYTATAERMVKVAAETLEAMGEQLDACEADIAQTPLSSIGNSPAPSAMNLEDPLGLVDAEMLSKHDHFKRPVNLADYHGTDDGGGDVLGLSTGGSYGRQLLDDLEASSGDDDDDDLDMDDD